MNELRFWCTTFFVWTLAVLSVDKWQGAISLTPLVDILAAAFALPIILTARLRKTPLPWLLLLMTGVFVLVKAWLKHPIMGVGFPMTVTQWCVLGITVALARRVGRSIEEVRSSLAGILLSHAQRSSLPFESGQGEMYREIRRARIHHRPLSLMVVSPAETDVQVSLDRFVKKIVDNLAHDYSQAQIAEFLSGEMKDCDIITQREGRFVVMLPETDRRKADETVQRLKRTARESAGLDLEIGVAAFPAEEVTFVGLLERAESDVQHAAEGDSVATAHAASTVSPTPAAHDIDFDIRPRDSELQAVHQGAAAHGNGVAPGRPAAGGDDDTPFQGA